MDTLGSQNLPRIDRLPANQKPKLGFKKGPFFSRENSKLCEKKFQIFQIFENEIRKSLEINERKAEPEGFEPSVRF